MATQADSEGWPSYPHIPIYLETYDDNGTARSYNTISPISPNFRPQDGAIQALAAASTQYIRPVSPAATHSSNLSPIWPIPEPPMGLAQQCPLRPTLRSPPTERPRVQLDHSLVPKIQEPKRESCSSNNQAEVNGLGILNRPFSTEQIASISPTCEKGESTPNIAQRIEQRLWRYTSSRNVIKRWLLEIVSWLISAVCMGAIVVVLFLLKDNTVPKLPRGLTLNAFIAVLSKISGAALILPTSEALGQLKWSWFQGDSKKMWDFEIFDNASRGPWGALLLLIRTKGRSLAAVGALITLFSLALDPFFQQVVDFPERWALLGESSIPSVTTYTPRYGVEFKNGVELIQQDQDIAAITQKFLYDNGTQPTVLGNGTRPDIPLSCPTSNCTWPLYNTLGVCSACADVSELLSFACFDNITVDWTANLTGAGTEASYPTGTMCGYFFNSTGETPVLMSGYMVEPGNSTGETLLMRTLPLISNPGREPLYGGSYTFKHVRNPLADFFVVTAANGTDSVLRHQAPIALECMLTWCVKTMNSSYNWGSYKEEVIHETINTTTGPFPWDVKRFIGSFNGTEVFYLQNVTIDAPNLNNSVFGVSNETAMYTIRILDEFLPSWTIATNLSTEPILRHKFALYVKGVNWRKLEFNPWLAPNNITRHMERMAAALTNGLRSSNSSGLITGDAYGTQTYVSVRWEWLSLPLGLLIMSGIFLVCTIVQTGREENGQVGVWKTSAIATLLYGLPDEMQEKITSCAAKDSEIGTPRAKAKQLKVKLLPTKGWRVSGSLFSPLTPAPMDPQSTDPQPNPHPINPQPTTPRPHRNQAPPGWI